MSRCFVFSVASLLLLSCTEVLVLRHDQEEPPVPVELTPRIIGVSTRAADTEWHAGDRLGVFMLKKNAPLEEANIIGDAHNRCYQVSEGGESTRLVSEETDYTMHYPADGSHVDFVAYYPYTPSINCTYQVRVDDQQHFPAIELLYGTATGNKQSGNVVMYMSHRLSKIRILLRKDTGQQGLELGEAQVSLHNMPLASGYCLSGTSFDYLNESGWQEVGDIQMQTIIPRATYEAIVLPQPAEMFMGRKITLTSSASEGWYIPDGMEYLSGKQYTYTFTLQAEGSLEFEDLTIRDWIDNEQKATAVEMVSIPGRTFLMGSSDGSGIGLNTTTREPGRQEDEILREVTLGNFMISRHPVTNFQYAAFLNSIRLPSDGIRDGELLLDTIHSQLTCLYLQIGGVPSIRWVPKSDKDDHPVTGVSWYGARAFARWQGGSLPTEEQWEYACRGGITPPSTAGTAYSFGNGADRIPRYAWYAGNNNTIYGNGIGTKQVGTRLMNPFTLYDMHGNVWEWCDSEYEQTGRRVLRGGAFDSPAEDCRSARRHSAPAEETGGSVGFRITINN